MAIPSYQSALDEARNTRAIGEIKTIEKEILFFEATQRRLPSTLAEVGKGDAKDPWGNAYEYLNFEEALKASKGGGKGGPKTPPGARKDKNLHPINSSFDLYSMGKDGKSVAPLTAGPSQDDIVRANDGGFVGLGSDY
jgi:general secretion pathway protein G